MGESDRDDIARCLRVAVAFDGMEGSSQSQLTVKAGPSAISARDLITSVRAGSCGIDSAVR